MCIDVDALYSLCFEFNRDFSLNSETYLIVTIFFSALLFIKLIILEQNSPYEVMLELSRIWHLFYNIELDKCLLVYESK